MGLKVFGAGLILTSGTMLGWIIAFQYINRVKQLKELQLAVSYFDTEIRYLQRLLADALINTGSRVDYPISLLFSSAGERLKREKGRLFSEIWQEILKDKKYTNCLIKEDVKILEDWGKQIGSSGLEEQNNINKLVLKKLEQAEKKAQEIADSRVKLSRYAGVVIGLTLIILFY